MGIEGGEELTEGSFAGGVNLVFEVTDSRFDFAAFLLSFFGGSCAVGLKSPALCKVEEGAAEFVGLERVIERASAKEIGKNFGFGEPCAEGCVESRQDRAPLSGGQQSHRLENFEDVVEAPAAAVGLAALQSLFPPRSGAGLFATGFQVTFYASLKNAHTREDDFTFVGVDQRGTKRIGSKINAK
jgi:hypothetical protein